MVRQRAGVRGSPIAHSLSPVLHRAAYASLGVEWDYDRVELPAGALTAHVAGLGPEWRGLSLTNPLKEEALALADRASELARTLAAANTLVHEADGSWSADNTDVAGVEVALREAGVEHAPAAVVVGSGATARSALAALRGLGARRVWLAVRDAVRPETAAIAATLGLDLEACRIGQWPHGVSVVIGTVPPTAYAGALGALPECGPAAVVLDCVYGHGPSPLLGVAREIGWTTVPGTEMLLHQAVRQVRLMTGLQPPVGPMREALADALAARDIATAPD